MILEPLRSLLLQNPTICNLISDRIYPVILPPITQLPAVRLTVIDEQTAPDTYVHTTRIQCSCIAQTYAEATTLAHQIRIALLNKMVADDPITILNITSGGGGMTTYEPATRRYHIPEDMWIYWRYSW